MIELLHNKLFVKKERWRILCFGGRAVWNSSDATVSSDNPSTISNAQEYLVSLYIHVSKMNLFVEDMCMQVVT